MKQATVVWEWENAPQEMRAISPMADDVDYLVMLPEGADPHDIPWWVETLNSTAGTGGDWKCKIREGEFAGRILIAVCHA